MLVEFPQRFFQFLLEVQPQLLPLTIHILLQFFDQTQ
nr:MAG TPA: hypothetical protein [Caudoviricetes sp.]